CAAPIWSVLASLVMLLLRRAPGSDCFPYTTLFRSQTSVWCQGGGIQAGRGPREGWFLRLIQRRPGRDGIRLWCAWRTARHGLSADRKSTRLNSSHVKISYAVFCLKKKHGQAEEALL